eukprot:8666622-Alexandrium_andersonii.AAC.1
MSASLVGSEMCIRDSANNVRDAPALRSGHPGPIRDTGGACGETLCPPVSYTHLTLPTICSV